MVFRKIKLERKRKRNGNPTSRFAQTQTEIPAFGSQCCRI